MEYTLKVKWGDTDAAGIVFYPNFYKWMDEATHEFFSAIGYPTNDLFREHIALPLLEAHCEFKKALEFNARVNIQTNVVLIKEKVFTLSHQFYCEEQLVAKGYEVRAWVSTANGKPKAVAIPEQVTLKLHQQKEGENNDK